MTIIVNDLIEKVGAAPAAVDDGSTSSIASAAFSVAADIAVWTNSDDAPAAKFILKAQWATITNVANKVVNIYARPINIEGTNDPVAPGTNRLTPPIGSFLVYAAAGATDYWFESGICDLNNFKSQQEYEFYLENQSGQVISAGWAMWIVPVTVGPEPAP